MHTLLPEHYKGWTIELTNEEKLCAAFGFTITSPDGETQQVFMGGKDADTARRRAREMVDMELALREAS